MSLTTTTEHHLTADLTTREGCIDAAIHATNNYKAAMLLIVEAWCKSPDEGGLGLPIEDLARAINRSPKTLKTDYVSVLRKQGKLPAAVNNAHKRKPSNNNGFQPAAGRPAVIVENAPSPQPKNDPVNPQEAQAFNDMTDVVEELLAENEQLRNQLNDVLHQNASEPELHDPTPRASSDPEVLSPCVQVGEGPLEDFNYVLGLIDEISRIQGAYHRTGKGWSRSQWDSLLGHLEAISTPARCRGNHGKGSESDAAVDVRIIESDSEA